MYKNRFDTLLDYCINNKIKVAFIDKEDFCYPKLNMVFIDSRKSWKNRLFALMHEIGHIEIFRNKDSWQKDFTHLSIDITDGRVKRSMGYQVSLVAEEIDAWRIGKQIAIDAGIIFDNEEYNRMMNDCVFSYIRSAYKNVNI